MHDKQQVGDEVSIVVGRFIPAGKAKEYRGDDFFVYFDSSDPNGNTPPLRVLVCGHHQPLEALDRHLGGNWWRLEAGYDHWIEGVAKP
jgi:hypothetical protein